MAKKIQAYAILSQEDVDLLKQNPAPEVRSKTAQKVSCQYKGQISETEKKIAEDIFRLIANDVEIGVRQTLAESLKDCANLVVNRGSVKKQ